MASSKPQPMDCDSEEVPDRVPTLGLVGATGAVEKRKPKPTPKVSEGPRLVAVSSQEPEEKEDCDKKEIENQEPEPVPGTSKDQGEGEPSARPRLTTTLLIFKKPSESGDCYVIGNAPPTGVDGSDHDESQGDRRRRKKKKKHKSKERTLSISRAYAQKLLEIQKSIIRLSVKSKREGMEEVERRRRTQSASSSSLPIGELISPGARSTLPYTPSPLSGKPSSFQGYKSRTASTRKRQFSTNSTFETSVTRRRLARKKRSEIDETRGNEIPGEEIKKNHLSENNVWTPLDDYRLLLNIMQTKGNLEQVFAGTKFSCFYTSDQIAHRWETIMYDEKAGVLAQNAITNLHPHTKAQIQTEALFSDEEEDLLRTIKWTPGGNPDLSSFIKLLEDNPNVFSRRTPRNLFLHWLEMKDVHLLDGQDVRDYKDPFNLFELRDGAYLASIPDMAVYHELQTESKQVKRQIRMLEEEIESWHCMQELVVSDGTSDLHSIFSISEFDDQTYAILRGKQVRYCMRSKEILLGRHSTNNKVDADLTLEGASGKVSRRQAIIQMHAFGEFFIINQGRHFIFVDNIHVPYGGMAKLTDGCVIQITHIKLIFKINEKLMRKEVTHEIKAEVINARYKTFENFTSPSYPSVSTLKSGVGSDVFPSTSRYTTSPKKRHLSSASSPSAPGLKSNVVINPLAGKQKARRGSGQSSAGNMGASLLPFNSGGDLTIRPSCQPMMSSSFVGDGYSASRTNYSRPSIISSPSTSDDVFKKPAPVTLIRTPGSKGSAVRTSTISNLSSAFAPVVGAPLVPNSSGNAYSSMPIIPSDSLSQSQQDQVHVQKSPSAPSILTPASKLMDYTKLGLSSDVTVTQMTGQHTPTALVSSVINAVVSSSSSKTTVTDTITTAPMPMPSLGLVKYETTSPSPSPTPPQSS